MYSWLKWLINALLIINMTKTSYQWAEEFEVVDGLTIRDEVSLSSLKYIERLCKNYKCNSNTVTQEKSKYN